MQQQVPTRFALPTGNGCAIDYSDPAAPKIAARLQGLFGTSVNPSLLDGRLALSVELLSPARRPVQLTRDLVGFWGGSYADVRKDMRGRYPRHPWPEDPTEAEATRRVKPVKGTGTRSAPPPTSQPHTCGPGQARRGRGVVRTRAFRRTRHSPGPL